MERNKLEKQLREQLQGREIRPSESAWDRILQQLEVSKTPKSIRFQWYGIAAAVISILFVSVLYFTREEPSIVPETEITDVKKDAIPLKTVSEVSQEEKPLRHNRTMDAEVKEEKSILSTSKKNTNKALKDALTSSKAKETKMKKVAIPFNTSEELIDTKIAEIVAQVEMLEEKNSTVTDAEIDSLLRGAQPHILEDKIFRGDKSVDAMALLADVEDELDRSFRDQIFDALKDGFLKVRTAVADGNK